MIVLTGAKGNVEHLAFSPDGRLLAATGGERELELWDIPSGNKWGRYDGMHFTAGPVAFHPTRPLCFAPSYSGIAEIETDTKKARHLVSGRLYTPSRFAVWAITHDGESFIGHGGGRIRRAARQSDDLSRVVWEAELARQSARSRDPLHPQVIRVCSDESFVCIDAARGRYGWNYRPERLTLRSMRDGSILGSGKLHSSTLSLVAVAPDGRRFVTARTSVMTVWDAADLEGGSREVTNDNRKHVTGFAFHPSGRYLAVTSNDATVKLYDTTSWQPTKSYTWEIGRMRSVAFSPDGSLAAAGSDTGQVVVWDVDL